MAVVYLEPGDLSPAQAERILGFLNGAASAEQIAREIEFPGELDIGQKLAERLLAARAERGGRFASLAQVRQVPQIGPERFTEICAAVLKLDPRHWVGQLGRFLEQQERLATRSAQLATQLAALEQLAGRAAVLELSADPQPAWLGQGIWIEARLSDAAGQALADCELTLESSAGLLESRFGFAVQRGPALRVRTGADGCARLLLQFQPLEPLSQDQQNALELGLQGLDAGAETPHAIRDGFLALAASYDDEHQTHLRRAIDIYARHYKAAVFERLNPDNAEYEWPLEVAVLRAHYHPQAGSSGVACSAVLPVSWKNWAGAWFEYLRQYLEQGRALQAALAAAKGRGSSGHQLVADLVGQAHVFVAGQKGLAAEWASQRLVGGAVREFLAEGLEGVDEATREQLFPNLEMAAEQLRVGNAGALALVDHTRAELQGRIDQVATLDGSVLSEVAGLRDEMRADARRVGEDIAAFDQRRLGAEQRLSGFERDYAGFNTALAGFNSQHAGFQRDYADFNAKQTSFNRDYGQFRSDYGTFNSNYGVFNNNLLTFNNNYASFNQDLASFNNNYSTFRTDYGKFTTDIGTFTTRYNQFGVDYGKFQTDLGGFNRDRGQLNVDIGNLRTQLNGVVQTNTSQQQQLGLLQSGLGTAQADIGTMRTELSGVKQEVATVKADVTTVKRDVGGMRTELTGVKTELTTVKTDVNRVSTDIGQVRLDVTGLNQRLDTGTLNIPGGGINRPR